VKRAKLNYWIDVVMGVAFVASAISGSVFLLPLGFLSNDGTGTLGLSYLLWNQLHTWSSLAMIVAVGSHLLLHTNWIAAMTRKLFARPARADAAATAGRRRGVLKLGGALVGGGVLAAIGATSLLGGLTTKGDGVTADQSSDTGTTKSESGGELVKADVAKASVLVTESGVQPAGSETEPAVPAPEPTAAAATEAPAPTATPEDEVVAEPCVACPHGLVNDPYPGRCRRYVDRDGDRICDLSVPQECG